MLDYDIKALELKLERRVGGQTLDPDSVVVELKRRFPSSNIDHTDRLLAQLAAVESKAGESRNKVSGLPKVIDTLERNVKLNGPHYNFEIVWTGGPAIKGFVQRYAIVLTLDEPVSDGVVHELLMFLKSFGLGVIQTTDHEGKVAPFIE